jgi:hypothetical protein
MNVAPQSGDPGLSLRVADEGTFIEFELNTPNGYLSIEVAPEHAASLGEWLVKAGVA